MVCATPVELRIEAYRYVAGLPAEDFFVITDNDFLLNEGRWYATAAAHAGALIETCNYFAAGGWIG